jgi:hypothetical protein
MYPTINELWVEQADGEKEDHGNFLSEEQLKIFRNEMAMTTTKLIKYGSKKQWQPEKTSFSRFTAMGKLLHQTSGAAKRWPTGDTIGPEYTFKKADAEH